MRGVESGATVQPERVQTGTNSGSYSAMHDGLLYLGTFEKDKEGMLHVYRPDGAGGWVERPDRAVTTPPQAQGVIVRDGEYVFSTSWGRHNESSLVVQQPDGSRESHTFPHMSEGLVEVNGNVLVTYESGSTEYSTPTLLDSGWLWGRNDAQGLWANPTMTSTPLSGLGLTGEMEISPDSLKVVASELEAPSRRLSSTAHETAAVHRTIRQLLTGLTDALRASGKAVGHAADSLRTTGRDALRTDDAVHTGFNRARLD